MKANIDQNQDGRPVQESIRLATAHILVSPATSASLAAFVFGQACQSMLIRQPWKMRNHDADEGFRALEMEVTLVGLQNAGKTSLLRVLAVGHAFHRPRARR